MLTIKPASESDISSIRSLAEKAWWPTYRVILKEEQIRYMLDRIYSEERLAEGMNTNEIFLLLHDKDGVQGFISYSEWQEDGRVWKINKLYILPECHGLGYGRKLLEEVKSRARRRKATRLVLNVNRHNPAFDFYKKVGFSVLREEDIPIGPYWMNDYIMELSL